MVKTERGATQEAVRRHNLATLLGHLHRHGPTSRASLTRLLGLNRATIGTLVDELADRGLVQEDQEPERGPAGRPSKVIRVRPGSFMVVAIEIGVDQVSVALVGLDGSVIDRDRCLLSRTRDRSSRRVVSQSAVVARTLVERSLGSFTLAAIGVAVPGAVRPGGRVVNFAPNLGWRNVPLADELQRSLGWDTPVLLGNDANLGAMAEHTRGVASGVSDLIYLYAEAGVGGGVITSGRMLEGVTGYGGEVGHMQLNPEGQPCRCGARGCWETEVGEDALVRRAGLAPGGREIAEKVLREAARGVPRCRAAVDETARWLSVGMAGLVNSLNPEMLILGGMFEDLLDLSRPTIDSALHQGIYDAEHQRVQVVKPYFGADAILTGAAQLALRVILDDPAAVPARGPGDALGALRLLPDVHLPGTGSRLAALSASRLR